MRLVITISINGKEDDTGTSFALINIKVDGGIKFSHSAHVLNENDDCCGLYTLWSPEECGLLVMSKAEL